MDGVAVLIAVAAAVAIFLTTPRGHAVAARLGLTGFGKGAASRDDHAFLLRECAGDRALVRERLAEARRANPEMSEAEAYRRAIRTVMNGRRDEIFDGVDLGAAEKGEEPGE